MIYADTAAMDATASDNGIDAGSWPDLTGTTERSATDGGVFRAA
jgi:hypothetical protein